MAEIYRAGGVPGPAGVGIRNVQINAGTLTVTLTDGRVIDVGGLSSEGGTAGATLQSATINAAGNLILTLSDGATLDAGNARGLTGSAGPQGPKGDKGDTGAAGAQGSQGPKGDTGAAGATGAQGPKGDTGAAGPQGPKGDTGAAGPAGAAGAAGPKGDTGPAAPDPFVVTDPIDASAVLPGNFGILRVGAGALAEIHPVPDELDDGQLYFKELDGTLKRAGGVLTYTPGGLTVGQAILASGKPGAAGRNWTAAASVPADLQPTATRASLTYGIAVSPTRIQFTPGDPLALDDTAAGVFDNLTSYALNDTAAVSAIYVPQWAALENAGTARPPLVGSDAGYPQGRFLRLDFGATNTRKVVTREDSAGMLDGETTGIIEMDGGTNGNLRLYARVSGDVNSPTGILAQLDYTTKVIKLGTLLNGTLDLIKDPAGVDLQYNMATLNVGSLFYWRYRFMGTRQQFRIWAYGSAEPATWTITAFSSTVMTPGKVGVGGNTGYCKVGQFGYSRNLLPAPVA